MLKGGDSSNRQKMYDCLMISPWRNLTAKCETVSVLAQENSYWYSFYFKSNRKSIDSSKKFY